MRNTKNKIVKIIIFAIALLGGFLLLNNQKTLAATNGKTFSVVISPKMISDFANPLPSIQQFYNNYQSAMSAYDQQFVIFYVGSGDEIYSYPSNAFNPPASQTQSIFNGNPLSFTPYSASVYNQATATLDTTDTVSGTSSYDVSVNGANGKQVLTSLYAPGQGILLKNFPMVSWSWKKNGGTTIAVQFLLHDRVSGQQEWVGYYAGATPPGATNTTWAQFNLGSLPQTWQQEKVNLYYDLYTYNTQAGLPSYQIGGQNWEIIGMAMTPYDGTDAHFAAIQASSDSGVSWARSTANADALNGYGSNGNFLQPFGNHQQYLNQSGRAYPQELTYSEIKNIVNLLRSEGKSRGLNVKIFDGVDAGPEFSFDPWRWGQHPELVVGGDALSFITPMNADPTSYASYPQGVPAGTISGDFIAKQIGQYVQDMGLDGIYSTNGFGLEPMSQACNVTYSAAKAQKVLNFFQNWRQAMGSKLIVWMDSYVSPAINLSRWSMPQAAYGDLDYLQISTFWQDAQGQPVVGLVNSNGCLDTALGTTETDEQFMQDDINGDIALKTTFPNLKLLWVFYYSDPWYISGYGAGTNTTSINSYKNQLDGAMIYSSDYLGNNVPQSWLAQFSTMFPAVVTLSNNYNPAGWLDGFNSQTGTVTGWAVDQDTPSQSIGTSFYIDGPVGIGMLVGSATTTLLRTDVNQSLSITGNHGFSWVIPSQYQDGKTHQLYVYGLDSAGLIAHNALLSGTPYSFSLGSIAVTLPVISSVAKSNITATTTTVSWSTNVPTNGQIFYGLTSVYGASSALLDNSLKTTNHNAFLGSLSPATTYHFKITSVDAAGNSTSTADSTFTTLAVSAPPAPVISSFSASPAAISSGSSATLSWTVSNATAISIDNGIGAVVGTSKVISPGGTTMYTLTAANASGSVTAQTTVTIIAPLPPVISNLVGGSTTATTTTISWTTDHVTSGQIDYGLTSTYGSSSALVNSSPMTTSHAIVLANLSPGTTYHFHVKSADGNLLTTTTADFTFTTSALPVLPTPLITSFIATPNAVLSGQPVTLSWSAANATSLSLDNSIGTVTGLISKIVFPATTTIYTLTAASAAGSATAQVTVSVSNTVVVSTATAPTIISFVATPNNVTAGQSAVLSWNVSGSPAPAVSIDNGLGSQTGTSVAVNPSANTTYTLTAANSAGTSTAQVLVSIVTVTTGGTGSSNSSGSRSSAGAGSSGSAGQSGNSGSSGGGTVYIPPVVVVPVVPVVPGSGTTLNQTMSGYRLVNSNGTFYLIDNGTRHGITNPGMLKSYGFTFSQAQLATANDLSQPEGSLLTPADGSLVKSQQDPTVYLISNQTRYAFTSPSVFLGLGFKFGAVLVVTDPELQELPKAPQLLNDAQSGHLVGLDVNNKGTIYWVGSDNELHPYPDLATYNSWHVANDFSTVVKANAADLLLPVGEPVSMRTLQ